MARRDTFDPAGGRQQRAAAAQERAAQAQERAAQNLERALARMQQQQARAPLNFGGGPDFESTGNLGLRWVGDDVVLEGPGGGGQSVPGGPPQRQEMPEGTGAAPARQNWMGRMLGWGSKLPQVEEVPEAPLYGGVKKALEMGGPGNWNVPGRAAAAGLAGVDSDDLLNDVLGKAAGRPSSMGGMPDLTAGNPAGGWAAAGQQALDMAGKARPYLEAAGVDMNGGPDGQGVRWGDMMEFGQNVAGAASGDPMSMVKAGKQVLEETARKFQALEDGVSEALRQGLQGFAQKDVFKAAEHGAGAGEELMKGVKGFTSGPFGLPTMASKAAEAGERLFRFGRQALEAFNAVRAFGAGLHASNMQFAEFSASMARVQAQQEVREIMLNREQGERRAATAQDMADAKARVDRQLAPIEDWWANFQNRLTAKGYGGFSFLVDEIKKAFGLKTDRPGETTGLGLEMIEQARQAGWTTDYGRPRPNFGQELMNDMRARGML